MRISIVCMLVLLFVVPALAETYTWEDDKGTVNFSGDICNVPKRYRKKARVIGEEGVYPAEEKDRAEKVTEARPQPGDAPAVNRQAVPVKGVDQNSVYGGKTAADWKSEFTALRGELKAAEGKLVENRKRLQDAPDCSRSSYLALQKTIKESEYEVLGLRKKLAGLKQDAEKAEVPAELAE